MTLRSGTDGFLGLFDHAIDRRLLIVLAEHHHAAPLNADALTDLINAPHPGDTLRSLERLLHHKLATRHVRDRTWTWHRDHPLYRTTPRGHAFGTFLADPTALATLSPAFRSMVVDALYGHSNRSCVIA